MRGARTRCNRVTQNVGAGHGDDERIARIVQQRQSVVEETKRAVCAEVMRVVLDRRIVARGADVVVARPFANRMPGMPILLCRRAGRSVRQRQQPMPQNRQDGDPHMATTMGKQTEHL